MWWPPMRGGRSGSKPRNSSSPNAIGNRHGPASPRTRLSGLRVAFADVAVRDRVKQAGGTWNPQRRVWQLRYDRVVALGLNSRIVDEPASNSGCPGASGENLHADARATSRQRCLHPLLDAGIPW